MIYPLNYLIADRLEPHPNYFSLDDGAVVNWISELKLWTKHRKVDGPMFGVDFHSDGNAMLALMKVLEDQGFDIEVKDKMVVVDPPHYLTSDRKEKEHLAVRCFDSIAELPEAFRDAVLISLGLEEGIDEEVV